MAKVTFNKSGSGSETGRLIIPALMLKILDIKDSKEDTDRRISITFVDNKIRIKKQKDKVDDDTYNKASSVVTFYSSGKSSRSGKVIIPVDMLQRLKITRGDNEVNINIENDEIIVSKNLKNEKLRGKDESMKVVSIFNIKGGVAKTISSINFAACLADKGKKVLLVDLDSQADTTKIFKAYDIDAKSVEDILLEKNMDPREAIKSTEYENLDIIASNIKLAFAEKKILLDTTRNQQNRLKKALDKLRDEYDYCIMDCPPNLNMITINALVASDEVLVPIKIDKFALDGLEYLLESIQEIKDEFNPGLDFGGCFITMDKATSVNKLVKDQLKSILEDKLFDTTIRDNVKVIESTLEEKPVIYYANKSNASKDYRNLVEEVF